MTIRKIERSAKPFRFAGRLVVWGEPPDRIPVVPYMGDRPVRMRGITGDE
ncbi:hypothetical protein [Thermostilla marina]